MPVYLGAIADDLTGATDLALMLTSAGFHTLVVVGSARPTNDEIKSFDAIVVALKSRTAPRKRAVAESVAAASWLIALGAERLYIKYCSTFDSTADGNIGPVICAILDQVTAPLTVVVPSFPANGRTVYQGHLFVGDRLLEQSSMREHPLTPMRDSDVVRLLRIQASEAVGLVPLDVVRAGSAAIYAALEHLATSQVRLAVVDATSDDDLAVIAAATTHLAVLTGGSALAAHLSLPSAVRGTVGDPTCRSVDATTVNTNQGLGKASRVVLSGSASATTQRQVRRALRVGNGLKLQADDVRTAAEREQWVNRVAAMVADSPLLTIYTVAETSDLGDSADAALLEIALGELAAQVVANGVAEMIIAGGETSGAVIDALDVQTLQMFPALSPGVGWARATRADGSTMDVVLKSGNFGNDDLFVTAWDNAPAATRAAASSNSAVSSNNLEAPL